MKRSGLVEVCGRLPLIGKYAVKPAYLWGYDAAKQGETSRKTASIAALGALAAIHIPNAIFGGVEMVNHVNSESLTAAYDGLYCAVNGLVAYTGIYLGSKVATAHNQAPSEEGLLKTHKSEYTVDHILDSVLTKEAALAAVVTLGGQAAFGVMNGLVR